MSSRDFNLVAMILGEASFGIDCDYSSSKSHSSCDTFQIAVISNLLLGSETNRFTFAHQHLPLHIT